MKSPKKNRHFDDGGLIFEELFFGKKVDSISIQAIITVLNGNCLDSFSKFKKEFNKDFNGFKPNSKLIKSILKKYPIDFDLNFKEKIIGNMKSSSKGIFLKRNLSKVFPAFTNFY